MKEYINEQCGHWLKVSINSLSTLLYTFCMPLSGLHNDIFQGFHFFECIVEEDYGAAA